MPEKVENATPGEAPKEAPDAAFVTRFRTRMPDKVARSFDEEQLRAIVSAFGTRRWKRHSLDLRVTIPFLGRHFYFVVLGGPERRSPVRRQADRASHPLATVGNAIFAITFFGSLLVSAFVVLYLIKSVLGIDLNNQYSLGLFADLKYQLDLLLN